MSATSRIVCDSHLERAVSNLFSLLLAPISSSSSKIGNFLGAILIGDKLIQDFDKKKAIILSL